MSIIFYPSGLAIPPNLLFIGALKNMYASAVPVPRISGR